MHFQKCLANIRNPHFRYEHGTWHYAHMVMDHKDLSRLEECVLHIRYKKRMDLLTILVDRCKLECDLSQYIMPIAHKRLDKDLDILYFYRRDF